MTWSPLPVVQTNLSHGNPLDDFAGDTPPAPVVDLRGAGVGVPGQVLDIFERHILAEQVRDHQDAERMRQENLREASGLQPPFEDALHSMRRKGLIGK